MQQIKENCYRGTRILYGNEKRSILNRMIEILLESDFVEISIPIIQFNDVFAGKVGSENQHMMYQFKDRGDRDLCLAPEYTAVVQRLASTTFKYQKNVKLFYVQECFRGERPQAGRYRQFTQLGVEILNPTGDYVEYLIDLAKTLLGGISNIEINRSTVRGLDYYTGGVGFEISCSDLGSSKQICGGGEYDGGIGFAIGIDRLLKIQFNDL